MLEIALMRVFALLISSSQISTQILGIKARGLGVFPQVSISLTGANRFLPPSSCTLLNPEFSGSPIVKDFLFGRIC